MANPFTLASLRGGVNTTDPPTSLSEDQCTEATNVEFNRSMLGERRRGASAISLGGTFTGNTIVTWLHRHLPSSDEGGAQLWALGVTGTASSIMAYKDTTWHTVVPSDAITLTGGGRFSLVAQSLEGKLFLAYDSAVDRLHVWDGTSLRRVGMAQPSPPTGANTGGGTMTGTRYYRVRFTTQVAGVTTRRSEPSTHLTITPASHLSVVVTKPSNPGEGETHWELEASKDNVLFYVLATQVIATTTYTDTTVYATGYAGGVLSEDIGDYTVPSSVRYLSADQDRLILAGSRVNPLLGSRVWWTPVLNDPGKGNNERIPLDTDNYLDLDGFEGGAITGLSDVLNGYIFVFKRYHIYKMIRTGLRARAYEAICITKERGAIDGSLVEGVDQSGYPALYFLDPAIGPCRLSQNGLQTCGKDILDTWRSVNLNATDVVCRGVYYPEARQVWWYVAYLGSNIPALKLVLQIDECRNTDNGVRRGWSFGTGPSVAVYTAALFSDNIDTGAARSVKLVPYIGVASSATSLIWLTDTGTTDNGTAYAASVTSRPFSSVGIINRFGVMAGILIAKASSGTSVDVTIKRDFGVETKTVSVVLTPAGTEDQVIKEIDNLSFSSLHTLQISFADLATPTGRWEINGFQIKQRPEDTA